MVIVVVHKFVNQSIGKGLDSYNLMGLCCKIVDVDELGFNITMGQRILGNANETMNRSVTLMNSRLVCDVHTNTRELKLITKVVNQSLRICFPITLIRKEFTISSTIELVKGYRKNLVGLGVIVNHLLPLCFVVNLNIEKSTDFVNGFRR
jgi:hypothetical protein